MTGGKLAELAGTPRLKGPVQVTCMQTGASRVCADEAEALDVIGGAHVEHRRGGFFYGGTSPDDVPVVLLEEDPLEPPAESPWSPKKAKKKAKKKGTGL